jgi:hypothetical protein
MFTFPYLIFQKPIHIIAALIALVIVLFSVIFDIYAREVTLSVISMIIILQIFRIIYIKRQNRSFEKLNMFIQMASESKFDNTDVIITVLNFTENEFLQAFNTYNIKSLEVVKSFNTFHSLVSAMHRNTLLMLQAAYTCRLEQEESGCEKLIFLTNEWIYFLETKGYEESEMLQILHEKKNEVLALVRIRKLKLSNQMECKNFLSSDEICSICLDPLAKREEIMFLNCKHVFHNDCIIVWISENPVCPLCKCEI